MMKALLRLAAVRDTKQAGELQGDTVHFIALNSALVLMTQNGNIYRPLTQTATCLLRLYSSNILQKTVNGSGRRQLAHGTTDEKSSSKVVEMQSTNPRLSCCHHELRKMLCEHVNGLCPAGWLNEQSITKHWF